jgi:hypothetical protein
MSTACGCCSMRVRRCRARRMGRARCMCVCNGSRAPRRSLTAHVPALRAMLL